MKTGDEPESCVNVLVDALRAEAPTAFFARGTGSGSGSFALRLVGVASAERELVK